MEELLLRHSFLPQRGVHPLLRRFRHQAVCGRWTSLFWPARQLCRTVELASPSPPSLNHYILVQIFTKTSPSIPSPSSHPVVTSLSSVTPSSALNGHSVLLTHGLRSMILPSMYHGFEYCSCVCFCPPLFTFPCSFSFPPFFFFFKPQLLFIYLGIYKKMYKQLVIFQSCKFCH